MNTHLDNLDENIKLLNTMSAMSEQFLNQCKLIYKSLSIGGLLEELENYYENGVLEDGDAISSFNKASLLYLGLIHGVIHKKQWVYGCSYLGAYICKYGKFEEVKPKFKLIFHGTKNTFDKSEHKLPYQGETQKFLNMLKLFASGKISELNCMIKNSIGWNLEVVNKDDYELIFMNCENISDNFIEQAKNRIRQK